MRLQANRTEDRLVASKKRRTARIHSHSSVSLPVAKDARIRVNVGRAFENYTAPGVTESRGPRFFHRKIRRTEGEQVGRRAVSAMRCNLRSLYASCVSTRATDRRCAQSRRKAVPRVVVLPAYRPSDLLISLVRQPSLVEEDAAMS
jgi:hypothetical protein